jgi:flagellar basal body L-ring protein FlgH
MMKSTLRAVGTAGFAVFWVAALIGCATYPTATAPVAPAPPAPETVSAHRPDYQENSLWQASNGLSGLFLDTKARNIGDIVTIEIAESSKATNKANTTGRDSSLSAGIIRCSESGAGAGQSLACAWDRHAKVGLRAASVRAAW